MNAISTSTKSLLEPGDLIIFPREGDNQAERLLSHDNGKSIEGGSSASAVREAKLMGSGGKTNTGR